MTGTVIRIAANRDRVKCPFWSKLVLDRLKNRSRSRIASSFHSFDSTRYSSRVVRDGNVSKTGRPVVHRHFRQPSLATSGIFFSSLNNGKLGGDVISGGGGEGAVESTAANEPCYRRGIVSPPAHCFPALLIVPRLAPRPPTNCTRPKNNAARNYFSIDARRHHPRHVEAVIARASASPGLKRTGREGATEIIATTLDTVDGWMDGNVEDGVDERSVCAIFFSFLSFLFSLRSLLIPTILRKLLTR